MRNLILAISTVVFFNAIAPVGFAQQLATPGDKLRMPAGFEAELLYTVPKKQGSWVTMTPDPKGRLIVCDQYGSLYRVDTSKEFKVEPLDLKIGSAQGLLCAFDSLYVVSSYKNNSKPPGLYRLKDTDGDDKYDEVKMLRKLNGGSEHGPHAVILSPDKKSIYVCAGNHTRLPQPELSRVPKVWQEDQVTPRLPDAGGHAVGRMAPGGWICKSDPEGKTFEVISSGYRNQYDIAFDRNGELFTWDADMEWDVGLPWYRPTRVCHATSGSEFGWRHGSGKWPDYFPDSLPSVVDIGPGSPTGITFGYGAKFPAKYQDALFIADWSYGIIYSISLEHDGASYKATKEPFCSAPALPVTDMTIHPDGSMYFLTGGRRFQSAMYRVRYTGNESTAATSAKPLNELQKLRRELEKLHVENVEASDENVALVWNSLSHEDRFIRFAARIALEHMPVDKWSSKVFSESNVFAKLESALALVRSKQAEKFQSEIVTALGGIEWGSLNETQRINLLRVYGLVTTRCGELSDGSRQQIAKLQSHFPADSEQLNRELARLLAGINEAGVVSKTLELLNNAKTQEEKIHYAITLHSVTEGWTPELRSSYFKWFVEAANLQGGNSFGGYLNNIKQAAVEKLSDAEKESLASVLNQKPDNKDPYAELKKRPVVKEWKLDDLLPVKDTELANRDLENGRRMFSVAQCYKCHRLDRSGGIVGPDLTNAGRRWNARDLLETIIDPSKEVSDQYQATVFQLTNGDLITGRIANFQRGDRYMVQEDMIRPGKLTKVLLKEIEDTRPAKVSTMPSGLLDTLSRDEILDLLAFMRSTSKN